MGVTLERGKTKKRSIHHSGTEYTEKDTERQKIFDMDRQDGKNKDNMVIFTT